MGVRALESTLPAKVLISTAQRPKSNAPKKTSDGRLERTIAADLKRVDDTLKASKSGKKGVCTRVRCCCSLYCIFYYVMQLQPMLVPAAADARYSRC
jgi:hypothetical protein